MLAPLCVDVGAEWHDPEPLVTRVVEQAVEKAAGDAAAFERLWNKGVVSDDLVPGQDRVGEFRLAFGKRIT